MPLLVKFVVAFAAAALYSNATATAEVSWVFSMFCNFASTMICDLFIIF